MTVGLDFSQLAQTLSHDEIRKKSSRSAMLVFIAAHICDQDGAAVFTAADILGTATPDRGALDGPIVMALLAAIHEVNELGKTTS